MISYLDDPAPVLAFAHRGGALHPEIEHLENSMRAFRHATDLGYRYLETDVHLTSDGELIAFHDDILDRVTDATGVVAETPWSELAQARIHGQEPIPTLAELFEELPAAKINIDLKAPGTASALARFLNDHDAHDRVCVGSFQRGHLEEFRRLTGGRVATSAHPDEVRAFVLSPTTAVTRRLTPDRPVALQVPVKQGRIPIVTRRLVKRAHALGVQVHVWTIDDPTEMNRLIDLGVDALITDRTDILRQVLESRGLWRETR